MASKKKSAKKNASNAKPTATITGADRRTAKRLVSMQSYPAFKSQLEGEYASGHLTRGVLSLAAKAINESGILRKDARLNLLRDYFSIVRS